jgi:hypothetical protein
MTKRHESPLPDLTPDDIIHFGRRVLGRLSFEQRRTLTNEEFVRLIGQEASALLQLTDAALAAEVKRVGLLKELSDEDKVYIDALAQECMRRFKQRRVWLGPGLVISADGFYEGVVQIGDES